MAKHEKSEEKMRTKTYFIITIMIKAIIVLVLFSSCDNDSEITNTVFPTFSPNYTATPYNNSEKSTKEDVENEHKHDYAKITENTATCMENGIMTYTCECGKQYTETIPTTSHNESEKTIKNPTCQEKGCKQTICKTCNAIISSKEIPAIGHVAGKTIVLKASCETKGSITVKCDLCEEVISTTLIPATGHNYDEIKTVTSTCTKQGYTEHVCVCGASFIDSYTATKEHNWNNWETDRKATTTSTGLKTRNCITCQKSESQIVAKTKTVDLNKITPIDLSKVYEEDIQYFIDFIVEAANKAYETNDNQECIIISIKETYCPESVRIKLFSYLSFYFNSFYGVYNMYTIAACPPDSTADYIYFYSQNACKAEKERRETIASIKKVLFTFEDGTEEYLINQICSFLLEKLSYDRGQSEATVAWTTGKGNCTAYAILFRQMAAQLGIESELCIGKTAKGGYHMWNKVQYKNGEVKYYDLTFQENSSGTKYMGATTSYHEILTINRYLTEEEYENLFD